MLGFYDQIQNGMPITFQKPQIALEREMALRSTQRYQEKVQENRWEGVATRTPSVRLIMDSAIIAVQQGIEEFLKEAKSGKAGKRHGAVNALNGLSSIEVAFITVKMILDGLVLQRPLTGLAIQIGQQIELEQRLRKFKKHNYAAFNSATKILDHQTSNLKHRKVVYKAVLKYNGELWEPWTRAQHCRVGLKLIEVVILKTGLIKLVSRRYFRRTQYYLIATNRFLNWLEQLDASGSFLRPEYWPTIIPPKKWTGLKGGGYYSDAVSPLRLVGTRSKEHGKVLKKADLTKVMSAINAIQDTPWSINKKILDVVSSLQESQQSVAGLPHWKALELPPRPIDIETNETAKKQWKRAAARVYTLNTAEVNKRLQALRVISTARMLSQYDRFYFPYRTDFRGRIYAVPQTFNPQGTDLSKALLQFADGDAIDSEEAKTWFFIHGANCFGVDKVTFDERCKWVTDNNENILASIKAPFDFTWWMEADKPFCFLAWAFEYAEYLKNPKFKSKIPIAMDGSCNGLQHYSAMLRDPIGAKATNVLPSKIPQDSYEEVADAVKEKLESLSKEEGHVGQLARSWLSFPIDRKITKRSVMILPYGGTRISCQNYVLEAVKEKLSAGVELPFPQEELYAAAMWLGSIVWQAISEVVTGAQQAMKWLKKVAQVLSKHGRPISWVTPSGFPVVQSYPKIKRYQIKTILCGHRLDPRVEAELDNTLDPKRQLTAIAPNFVHSYDAAALVLTVLKAKAQNITKFAMIHDSYATTAKYSSELAKCLREAFIEIYDDKEVLMNFYSTAIPDDLKDKIEHPPFIGGFSISEVQHSPYFFA